MSEPYRPLGLFGNIGSATKTFWEERRRIEETAEKQRQFDENLKLEQDRLALEQQKYRDGKYFESNTGFEGFAQDLLDNGEYMDPDHFNAYSTYVSEWQTAYETYKQTGDDAVIADFYKRYPGGKIADGPDGTPVTVYSIRKTVNQRKPGVIAARNLYGVAQKNFSDWLAGFVPETPEDARYVADLTKRAQAASEAGEPFDWASEWQNMVAVRGYTPSRILTQLGKPGAATPEGLWAAYSAWAMFDPADFKDGTAEGDAYKRLTQLVGRAKVKGEDGEEVMGDWINPANGAKIAAVESNAAEKLAQPGIQNRQIEATTAQTVAQTLSTYEPETLEAMLADPEALAESGFTRAQVLGALAGARIRRRADEAGASTAEAGAVQAAVAARLAEATEPSQIRAIIAANEYNALNSEMLADKLSFVQGTEMFGLLQDKALGGDLAFLGSQVLADELFRQGMIEENTPEAVRAFLSSQRDGSGRSLLDLADAASAARYSELVAKDATATFTAAEVGEALALLPYRSAAEQAELIARLSTAKLTDAQNNQAIDLLPLVDEATRAQLAAQIATSTLTEAQAIRAFERVPAEDTITRANMLAGLASQGKAGKASIEALVAQGFVDEATAAGYLAAADRVERGEDLKLDAAEAMVEETRSKTAVNYAGVEEAFARAGLIGAQTGLTEAQTEGTQAGTKKTLAETALIGDQRDLTRAQTGLTNAQTRLTDADVIVRAAQAENIRSDTSLNNAQVGLTDAQAGLTRAQTGNVLLDSEIKRVDLTFAQRTLGPKINLFLSNAATEQKVNAAKVSLLAAQTAGQRAAILSEIAALGDAGATVIRGLVSSGAISQQTAEGFIKRASEAQDATDDARTERKNKLEILGNEVKKSNATWKLEVDQLALSNSSDRVKIATLQWQLENDKSLAPLQKDYLRAQIEELQSRALDNATGGASGGLDPLLKFERDNLESDRKTTTVKLQNARMQLESKIKQFIPPAEFAGDKYDINTYRTWFAKLTPEQQKEVQPYLDSYGKYLGELDKISAGFRDLTERAQALGQGGGVFSPGASGPAPRGFTPQIRSGVQSAATELGVDPNDLAAVIGFETAGTFAADARPKDKNGKPISSAVGLIQFTNVAVRSLRRRGPDGQMTGAYYKDSEEFFKDNPTAERQMPYVVAYLRNRGVGPGSSLADIYRAIIAPYGDPKALYTKARNPGEYTANINLDRNRDGVISLDEAVTRITESGNRAQYFEAPTPPRETQISAPRPGVSSPAALGMPAPGSAKPGTTGTQPKPTATPAPKPTATPTPTATNPPAATPVRVQAPPVTVTPNRTGQSATFGFSIPDATGKPVALTVNIARNGSSFTVNGRAIPDWEARRIVQKVTPIRSYADPVKQAQGAKLEADRIVRVTGMNPADAYNLVLLVLAKGDPFTLVPRR